jgi:hypothetical protein
MNQCLRPVIREIPVGGLFPSSALKGGEPFGGSSSRRGSEPNDDDGDGSIGLRRLLLSLKVAEDFRLAVSVDKWEAKRSANSALSPRRCRIIAKHFAAH